MESYGNDLQTQIGGSDNKSVKGKRTAEELSYSVRRESSAQSQHIQTEGQTSSRHSINREIYHQRQRKITKNTVPEPKIRKKSQTGCSLELLANFPLEDREEIIKDKYRWKRYQQVSTDGLRFPSFSYKCMHPGCAMKMHTMRVSLHPDKDKIMVSYEGVHNHSKSQTSSGKLSAQSASQNPVSCRDLLQLPFISASQNQKRSSQNVVPEEIPQRLQSASVHIVNLDQYIEHLKPNYGIFLKQPSKIKYGVFDDHVAENAASICGINSSPHGYGEPHQGFYAVNNICHAPVYSNFFHNLYYSQQLQHASDAAYHSIPLSGLFPRAESPISLGIQCTNLIMAGGEINFQYNLMQRNYDAGYYTFKPLAYEQPSSSLMAGRGHRNSEVIDGAEQLQCIHPSHAQHSNNMTENYDA